MIIMKTKMKRKRRGGSWWWLWLLFYFTCINLLNPYTTHQERDYYFHFIVEETEAQRNEWTFSRSLKLTLKKPMLFLLIPRPHVRTHFHGHHLSCLLGVPRPTFWVTALPSRRLFESCWCPVYLTAALWCLKCWPNVCLPTGSLWLSICSSLTMTLH